MESNNNTENQLQLDEFGALLQDLPKVKDENEEDDKRRDRAIATLKFDLSSLKSEFDAVKSERDELAQVKTDLQLLVGTANAELASLNTRIKTLEEELQWATRHIVNLNKSEQTMRKCLTLEHENMTKVGDAMREMSTNVCELRKRLAVTGPQTVKRARQMSETSEKTSEGKCVLM